MLVRGCLSHAVILLISVSGNSTRNTWVKSISIPFLSSDFALTSLFFSSFSRTRLSLTATQAFYLLVNNQTLPCPSLTILEIYNDNKDEDGFLYMTYASQEMFGAGVSLEQQ